MRCFSGLMLGEFVSNTEHLSIYSKIYKLVKYLYGIVNSFPKEYKYTLGSTITSLSWECLDLVIKANSVPVEERYKGIKSLSNTFDCLKVRIRMAQELNLVSTKQYSHIIGLFLGEIGEMIGGWLVWSMNNGRGN